LADEFTAATGLPAVIDNDVNALALGESHFGAGRGFQDVLYVAVGTGVGAALMLAGQLRRGATWTAGEIGHLMADWDGDARCSCGRCGHLEAYTSGPALAARYCAWTKRDTPLDLRAVAARAQAGDDTARRAIALGADILGRVLGGLLNVLDPQALVIGGGVAELGDLWWGPLTAALRANPMPGPAQIVLRPAQLGPDAVLVGAAWLARQRTSRT
jgi:glucokinase